MFPSGSLGNLMHLHNCATRYGMIKMCDRMVFSSMYFYPWH